jgi:hypothetical protein
MKRTTLIVLTIVALSFTFGGQANLSLNTANLSATGSDVVSLAIDSDSDVFGIQFDVKYDANALQLTENAISSTVTGVNVYSKIKEDGHARVVMFSLQGDKIIDINSGNIANIVEFQFESVDNFIGTSSVELKDITVAGEHGEELTVLSSSFDVDMSGASTPVKTELKGNFPNPFNPTTQINFNLSQSGEVSLVIYDIMGREVETLVNGFMDAKSYDITWDASNVASGRYLAKLTAPGYSDTITMTLLK